MLFCVCVESHIVFHPAAAATLQVSTGSCNQITHQLVILIKVKYSEQSSARAGVRSLSYTARAKRNLLKSLDAEFEILFL